ncbi:MAG: HIT domain-containing protein [Rhodothermales bacterium]|nr:HIT domain-containing protein [Rhodothermales bacterium]MBO6780774.1 HIT domain-containing protein [Rhodothermales bacterium]
MEHLWSPWRTQHVEEWSRKPAGEKGSLFERLAAEDRDEENLILWRGETCFVIMNLYPYNNGHCMIVPYRRIEAFREMTGDERREAFDTVDRVIGWLEQALSPDGFNVGVNQGEAAGAGIPDHLHVHVVPRWQSDTNFMPTTAQTKVIPEALRSTYAKLRAAIAEEA